jgi:hypothetical protein
MNSIAPPNELKMSARGSVMRALRPSRCSGSCG